MKAIGYITVFFTTAILGPIWQGYVLSILWRWFIIATFGAPALGVAQAIGLSCVVSFLTARYRVPVKDERSNAEKIGAACAFTFFGPLFALAFGSIVHRYL